MVTLRGVSLGQGHCSRADGDLNLWPSGWRFRLSAHINMKVNSKVSKLSAGFCLPVSGLVSVCLCVCLPELCRRFLARPPRGWRLECWHNRCCLTKPIIICCTAVCPYPLFLLPLLPPHILLRLLAIYVSSSWSVIPLHPQTFTPACENYIYLLSELPAKAF